MRTTGKTLAAIIAIVAGLAADRAAAETLADLTARLDALEKQNAAIRRENAALRENQRLREQNAQLKSQAVGDADRPVRAVPPVAARASGSANPFDAYAADMPVKALPPGAPGQFRAWVEGGAIWSGGDPVSSQFNNGQFDLTPKVGWEAAVGFDHRFANSPWHISGQFRYGEGGKTSGSNVVSQTVVLPTASGTITTTDTANYKESHWLADIAVGRDIVGTGPGALQLKGGLRVAEFTQRTFTSNVVASVANFSPPVVVAAGFPAVSTALQTSVGAFDQRTSFLGAGPLIGLEGSVPFAGRWSFDYSGDAAILLGRQQLNSTTSNTTSTTPAFLAQLNPPTNVFFTNADRQFSGVLSADIQVGLSYWLTPNLKLGAGYRLDALINVFNESGKSSNNVTPDRYTHGPRVILTGQFDAL